MNEIIDQTLCPFCHKYLFECKCFMDKGIGIKDEEDKLDYSEINLKLLDLMAKRFSENKTKYPKGNSKIPIEKEKLYWAMFRHLRKILQPVKDDPEIEIDHIAAIGCNLSMILDQIKIAEELVLPQNK